VGDPAGQPTPGAFAPGDDGRSWVFRGALTFDNAGEVLEAAAALPLPAAHSVDLAQLTQADSSALAVLFALKRRARSEHHALHFVNPPAGVTSLARVYGVDELLFPAPR
jgi:phospholipid transport system transporter-binding protein